MNSLAWTAGKRWQPATALGLRPLASHFPWLCLVAVCLGTFGGCQSQRERFVVDAFSAEARMLEDKIYELQDRVGTLERRMVQQRERGIEPSGARSAPARPSRDESRPTPSPVPGFDLDEIPELTPPDVDPGTPARPADFGEAPSRSQARPVAQGQPTTSSVSGSPVHRGSARQVASSDSDRQVTGLFFEAYLLGDAPADGSRLHGLELLIVPVNDRDQLVPVAGEVTVVVLNSRDGSHVGRWEYDTATARAALAAEGSEPGILLELRWREVLKDPRLHVYVRFQLPDGRRVEADRPFVVAGKSANTPRPESGSAAIRPSAGAGKTAADVASEAAAMEPPREFFDAARGESSEVPGELPPGPVETSTVSETPSRQTAEQREQGPPAAIYR